MDVIFTFLIVKWKGGRLSYGGVTQTFIYAKFATIRKYKSLLGTTNRPSILIKIEKKNIKMHFVSKFKQNLNGKNTISDKLASEVIYS